MSSISSVSVKGVEEFDFLKFPGSYETWLEQFKNKEKKDFNVNKIVDKKAGNAMVIMWIFSVKRRAYFNKKPPHFPGAVRNLVANYVGVESWEKIETYNTLRVIAQKRLIREWGMVAAYYTNICKERAEQGHYDLEVPQEIFDKQPELSNGQKMKFSDVAAELRLHHKLIIDGSDEVDGDLNETFPHTIEFGCGSYSDVCAHMRAHLEQFDKLEHRGNKKNSSWMRSHANVKLVFDCNEARIMAKQKTHQDSVRAANALLTTVIQEKIKKGSFRCCVTKAEFDALPKPDNGKLLNNFAVTDLLKLNGFHIEYINSDDCYFMVRL